MILHFDLDSNRLVSGPTGRSGQISRYTFMETALENLTLRFWRGREAEAVTGTPTISFGLKTSASATDAIALASSWTNGGAGTSWGANLNLNTEEMLAAIGSADSLAAYAQLRLELDSGAIILSQPVPAHVLAAILTGAEGTPSSLPTPDAFVEARALCYDRAQSLSAGEKSQALVNLGLPGLNNFSAARAPLATDDIGEGYTAGSLWLDIVGEAVYRCVDPTSSGAVWHETTLDPSELGGAAFVGISTGGNGAADSGKAVTYTSIGDIHTTGGFQIHDGYGNTCVLAGRAGDNGIKMLPEGGGYLAFTSSSEGEISSSDVVDTSSIGQAIMTAGDANAVHEAAPPVEMTRQERMTADVSEGALVKVTDEGGRIEQYLGSRADCAGLLIAGGVADGVALTRTDTYLSGRHVWASHPHNLYLGNAVGAGEARLSWDGANWQLETSGGTVAGNTEDHPADDGGEFDGGSVIVTESAVAGDQNWRVVFNSAYVTLENLSPYGTTPTVCLNSEENVVGYVPNSTPLVVGWVNEADILFDVNSIVDNGYGELHSSFELHAIQEEAMPKHQHALAERWNTSDPYTPRLEHLWQFLNRPRPVVTVVGSLVSYS